MNHCMRNISIMHVLFALCKPMHIRVFIRFHHTFFAWKCTYCSNISTDTYSGRQNAKTSPLNLCRIEQSIIMFHWYDDIRRFWEILWDRHLSGSSSLHKRRDNAIIAYASNLQSNFQWILINQIDPYSQTMDSNNDITFVYTRMHTMCI